MNHGESAALPDGNDTMTTLRSSVRAFLDDAVASGLFEPIPDSWLEGHDPAFSELIGEKGWLGMTWPSRYGGHDRPQIERFVVVEELLAAGAPVAAHWIAERQTGPQLLRFGTEQQRERFLPDIARGRLFTAAGLSEPDTGSDLASLTTTASETKQGWVINGTKVWTSHAHRSHIGVILARTSREDDRHKGLSQFLVDLDSPGLSISPIVVMTGEPHFAEVHLEDVFVPHEMVLGDIGSGWSQITAELTDERAGPERLLSTFPLLATLIDEVEGGTGNDVELGRVISRLWGVRLLSRRLHEAMDSHSLPPSEPAIVKDQGTRLERRIVELSHDLMPEAPSPRLLDFYRRSLLASPSFTLRGGTNEILRTIIARTLSEA